MKNFNTVYIAFGSNKGSPHENIKKALDLLKEFCEIKKLSPLYLTKPEGYLEQPDFINGALEATTSLAPQELLSALKNIEKTLGRKPSFRNAPREIDLDILFYAQEILHSDNLDIPHKSLSSREFVLAPLSDIAPDFTHPQNGKTIKELLQELLSQKQHSDIILLK